MNLVDVALGQYPRPTEVLLPQLDTTHFFAVAHTCRPQVWLWKLHLVLWQESLPQQVAKVLPSKDGSRSSKIDFE